MRHPAIITLEYLERTEQKNEACRAYVQSRIPEVERFIARLHKFASHKPGRVADNVTNTVDSLQVRLDNVIA